MYSIVIFICEKGTPVEGVPSTWLKNIEQQMYCYWPKKDASQLIRRCLPADPSWRLCKCQVLGKAANYDLMIKQRNISMELTLENETENSVVEESPDSDSEMPSQPSTSSSKPQPSTSSSKPQPSSKRKLPKKKLIYSESDEEIISHEKKRKSTKDFMESPASDSKEMKETLTDILGKVNTLVTNSNTHIKSNRALFKEILEAKEEIKYLKKTIKKMGTTPIIEHSNLPSLPVKTKEELDLLEEMLNDETELNNCIKKLSNFGGSNLRSTVNNVMKNAISNSIAIQYTLQGKSGKLSFMKLKLFTAIQGENISLKYRQSVKIV